ncbi:hypothetical protein DICPUDRAFT_39223 [Dictyostelium purpureum]|uniref:DNA replication complex GINS protein PSF2 n=1 Tax=Dictyostelium purpureum TaxID=5786 RepID=F0ZVX7_DICPU|nr:uncharacterized protein DICPUDRAFT_39223 [Dictyostelium purpureum]EGC31908.1 hypothetical protein DICPUDRAFT_39223 [Dictyostelium purpureum]|eukprot:XP_003291578.1 hypothetical protein DICPUDRAFT_39223 [Dictyostelium purpureum]
MEENIGLTPNQIEFLAEDTIITIVPNFKMESLIFLSGEYGPFIPSFPVKVPLWLAVSLKKKKKCNIVPPEWMSFDYLEQQYIQENRVTDGFVDLPDNFIEISTMLLSSCPEDINDVNKIRSLIEDILNRRQSKLNNSLMNHLQSLKDNEPISTMEFKNFSMMEINRVRSSFVSGINHLYKIQSLDNNDNNSNNNNNNINRTQSNSQTASRSIYSNTINFSK